ncbi:MAG: hypothetical protein M3065_10020 [Actinomycetota bacterium]|nr:hypothetical protein [Actinomycetota bacterium]
MSRGCRAAWLCPVGHPHPRRSSRSLAHRAQYAHSYDFDFLLPIRAPDRALEVFQAEVDAALAYGGMWIGVFHPFVSGRPSRLARVRTLLEQLISRGDVWVASLGEIATHVIELERSGTWTPRHERVPYYTEPVSELSGLKGRGT